MILVASFPFLNLYLHEGPARAMEAEWLGFAGSAAMRQAFDEILRLVHLHRPVAWIGDDRKLGPVRPADLERASAELIPLMTSLGLKRLALVDAENPLNQLLIKTETEAIKPKLPLDIQYFASVEEARAWACAS